MSSATTTALSCQPLTRVLRNVTARYLVGGPGWSGAGPAAVGTGVLPRPLGPVAKGVVVGGVVSGCG